MLFYEEDEEVIIDYITDDVLLTGKDVIENKFKPQILSYKEAIEKLTGKNVKACFLYLLKHANLDDKGTVLLTEIKKTKK